MTELRFDDFRKIVKGLKSVYTAHNFLPDDNSVKVWYHMLKDMDYQVLSSACYKHMATNRFPPTPADIREESIKIIAPETCSGWSEGWEVLMKAIQRFGRYQQEEAFASMDVITRTVAKRLGWKNLCLSENISVDRANFRQVYEQEKAKEIERMQLPMHIQEAISAIGVRQIKGGDDT